MSDPVSDLLEQLADAEHAGWSRWMIYLFDQCIVNKDGSLTIPAHLVDHWRRQANTQYASLSEPEKEADRDEVRRIIIPILVACKQIEKQG
ncbi:MAG: hypothetical protein M1370_09090 [Bacteroidetes bacterium]|nr:hypothetical protein [Bacteroidota bacterium]